MVRQPFLGPFLRRPLLPHSAFTTPAASYYTLPKPKGQGRLWGVKGPAGPRMGCRNIHRQLPPEIAEVRTAGPPGRDST
jgi:hypothetical protein